MRTWANFLTLTLMTGALVGCGGTQDPGAVLISGVVTYNGQPVETGEIRLRPVDADTSGGAGKIENGQFRLQSPPGKMKASIIAFREIPGKVVELNPGEKSVAVEQYIPSKFNDKTELVIEVQKNAGEFKLDLMGK